ncbi:hypothetical protein VTL71DRAFT_13036 [Oculimacula yallundae]|uniref:Uncharacterized protein n=1 Tax=Oculimacula yallundae TaxID=86028 RepID=A0ABR4CPA7_9HELO
MTAVRPVADECTVRSVERCREDHERGMARNFQLTYLDGKVYLRRRRIHYFFVLWKLWCDTSHYKYSEGPAGLTSRSHDILKYISTIVVFYLLGFLAKSSSFIRERFKQVQMITGKETRVFG